jgi:chemotaxis protein CheX
MANSEAVVRSIDQNPPVSPSAGITAVLGLGSATQGCLLLNFSEQTATAVAKRVLAGATDDLSESIVRDCIGEVANVVGGQAKALLAETPFRITLSMPKVVTDPLAELDPSRGLERQTVIFDTELGAFTLHLLSAIS